MGTDPRRNPWWRRLIARLVLSVAPADFGQRRIGPLHLVHDWTGRRYIGIPWIATIGFGPIAMIERVWIGPWLVYADIAAMREGQMRRALGQESE